MLFLYEQGKKVQNEFFLKSLKFFFILLRLLGISSDCWQMVYRNELLPSDVESSYSTLTLFWQNPLFFSKKSCFFFLLDDIDLLFYLFWDMPWNLKILEFLHPRFQMHIFGTRYTCHTCSWLKENFFNFTIKSMVKDLLLAMFIGVPAHLFSNWFLLSLHEVHSIRLIGGLESFSFQQCHWLAPELCISHITSLVLGYLCFKMISVFSNL